VGSDGNLWYGDFTYIGRISPSTGAITEYPMPGDTHPEWITEGPDCNIWFAGQSLGDATIGKITPSGTFTEYPLPSSGDNPALQNPTAITAGPDGNLWFVDDNNDIGLITTTGTVLINPMPAPESPGKITAGNDGNLWFTDSGTNSIGRITRFGVVTEFPLPSTSIGADAIVAGPDGNVWFTEVGEIGKITPSGTITEYPISDTQAGTPDITVGPDGNLYWVESTVDQIGRITPQGVVTEFALPQTAPAGPGFTDPGDHPMSIAAGSDGRLWVLDIGTQAGVMAIQPDQVLGAVTPFPEVPVDDLSVNGAVSAFHDPDPVSSPSSYVAVISWGDGTQTSGTLSAVSNGNFDVSGTHTYVNAGTYTISVAITDIDTSHDLGGSTYTTTTSVTTSTDGGGGVGGSSVGGKHHHHKGGSGHGKKGHHPTTQPSGNHHQKAKPKMHKAATTNKSGHQGSAGTTHTHNAVHTSQIATQHTATTIVLGVATPRPPVFALHKRAATR
jgi:streptogramin lyase